LEEKNPSTIEELDYWRVCFSGSLIIVKHKFNMPSTPCPGPFPLIPLEIIKGGSQKFFTNSHHLHPLILYLIKV
jgi:hypothetical protein